MTGINHVMTGTAIALAIQEPVLVAPLAFLSHFILDAIPHFDHPHYRFGSPYFVAIMATDALLCLCAVVFFLTLVPSLAPVIALATFCAILPDIGWLYYYTQGQPQWWFFRFHIGIQWFERPPGAIVEIAYAIFIITVLLALTWRV